MPKPLNELWGGTTEFSLKSYATFSTGNFRTTETFSANTRPLYTEEHFDNSAFNTFVKNQPFFNLVPMGYYGGSYLPFTVNNGNIIAQKSLQNNSLIYPVPAYRSGDISSEFKRYLYPNVDSNPNINANPIVSYDKMYKLMISDNNRGADYISLIKYDISEKTSTAAYISDVIANLDNENVFFSIQYRNINPFVSGNHAYDYRNVTFMHLFENNIPYGKFNVMTLKESPITNLTKSYSGSSSNMFSVIFNNNHFCYGDIKNDINIPVADFENGYYNIVNPDDTSKILFNKTSDTNYQLIGFLYSAKDLLKLLCFLYGLPIYIGNYNSVIQNINTHDVLIPEILTTGEITGNWAYGDEIPEDYVIQDNDTKIRDKITLETTDVSNDDKIDNINYGTQTSLNINQFVSSYVLDGVDLQNLSNEFKNPTNEIPSGDTPFENIISLKKYPFNVKNHVIMYEPSNIILSKWDTNVSAQKINATQTLINIGSFFIDRKYNNFLDYEPYTTCEIYLPFADYVPINLNKCMGSTINIEMIWDIDGNIKYLILCEGLLIAEINANLSSSQTLTAINSGLKSLQDLQNTITIASGLTSVAGSAVAGSPIGIVSSAISTVSGVVNAVTNQNTNYSTQKGQSQSDVSQKTILDFILHITRPIVKIPANYASTIGYILNDTKVLSELSGFTVCDNVIINNINCLNNEKTEIKNLLETGVIL